MTGQWTNFEATCDYEVIAFSAKTQFAHICNNHIVYNIENSQEGVITSYQAALQVCNVCK